MKDINNVKLSIIGNVADDEMFHGLWVSPDIDTITYTLSGLVNRTQGWGLKNETQNALSMLKNLDCDTWMMLGDKDFGLHIYRTERRNKGERPSVIARDIAKLLKVKSEILLPTDDVIQTKVKTEKGWLSFQEYFVKEKCIPEVQEICYEGISQARANQECIETIQNSDFIVINYRDWAGKTKDFKTLIPKNYKIYYQIKIDDNPLKKFTLYSNLMF